jgi:CRISPR system Cascade subunit CasD
MIDVIILRFDAPLISFGGVVIDQNGVTRMFPARSMLTGLLANALGYDHRDFAMLQNLQERIQYAVRCDRAGTLVVDYQTVDLSQPFLARGWTTWGVVQERGGAQSTRTGTHIRWRQYLADAVYTVALTLQPAEAEPDAPTLAAALQNPARPLFIGRKPCLPAEKIFVDRFAAKTLRAALLAARLSPHADGCKRLRAWFPAEAPSARGAVPVTEDREWANQIHVGRRFVTEEFIDVSQAMVHGSR